MALWFCIALWWPCCSLKGRTQVLGFYTASSGRDLVTGIAIGVVLTSILKHVACIGSLASKSLFSWD